MASLCTIIVYGLCFSDCNWGDHVGDISDTFGVTGQRTPNGLQWREFVQALETYKEQNADEADLLNKIVR